MDNSLKTKKVLTVGKSSAPYSEIVRVKTETGGFGNFKLLIIALFILIDVAFLLYIDSLFVHSFKWVLNIRMVLSILTCIYALSSNKNGLSKAVWIIFMLICFTFAFVLYILSDDRIFFRGSKKRYKVIYENAEKYRYFAPVSYENNGVKSSCLYLKNAGKANIYDDSRAKYFCTGAQLFDDVIERLKSAQKFVFIEYFIISDGILLNRVFDQLADCVKRGVEVRIVYDDMGCFRTFSSTTKAKMRSLGIKINSFNKMVPIFSVAMNYRDHRKIMVIDGKCCYTGGSNLADEYINEKRAHGYWKDNGIRIEGKAVDGFTLMFLRQWEFLSKKSEDYSQFLNHFEHIENRSVFVPYADGFDVGSCIGKSAYENAISSAHEKIYIMTPYFIVDETISNLLINKARSGVDVRIILPEKPDKKLVYGVTRNNAEKLTDYGVKVFVMKNSFVHSKVLLTENSVTVGTINMDLRSFYQQFECALYTNDQTVMTQVDLDFKQTFNDCEMIVEKERLRNHALYRLFAGMMQIFAPFM